MLRRPWLLNIVLIALVVAAGVRLAAYLRSPLPELPGAPATAADGGAGPAPAGEGAGAEEPDEVLPGDYDEIAAHNLFSQTRGVVPPPPPAAAKAAAPAKVQPPPKVTLYGVVTVDGERAAFLVEGGGDAKPRKLREGEAFAGGTLKAIRADGVTLSFPSGEVNVALRTPKDGAAGQLQPAPRSAVTVPTPARVQPGQRRFTGVPGRRSGTAAPAVPVPGTAVGRPGAARGGHGNDGAFEEELDSGDYDDEDYLDEDYLDDEEDYYDGEEDYYDEDY